MKYTDYYILIYPHNIPMIFLVDGTKMTQKDAEQVQFTAMLALEFTNFYTFGFYCIYNK